MRKGKAAGQWALNRVKNESFPGYCKKFVRSAFDVPSKSLSAAQAWRETRFKVTPKDINDTPAFVPAYFDTGPNGHVVITIGKDSHGRRLCVSTDVQDSDHDGRREVGIVPLEKLLSWGRFQGFGYDLDGVMVAERPAAKKAPAKKATVKGKTLSVTDVAEEIVAGKWGNGVERKHRIQQAGYNYAEVQDAVNAILKRR
jgi:hypothetical protein